MGRWFAVFLVVIAGAWWLNARQMKARSERAAPVASDGWQVVAPGVEMRALRLGDSGTRVVALRAPASRVHLVAGRLLQAGEWQAQSGAVAVINGGYFDADNRALGLRVASGRQTSPLRHADWGVLVVRGGRAQILHTRDFKGLEGVQEAVQCGPRLVVAGVVTDLKPQWARRSGVGIMADGRVVLAVCDGQVSFGRWAAMWRATTALNCRDALNLDGGGSTQLCLRAPKRDLDIGGFWPVPDALIVK